jgi:hypothetical protein
MRIFNIFLLLSAIFLLNGCIPKANIPFLDIDESTDFKKATKELVSDMHDEITLIIPRSNNLIYVSDFVNIKNLKVTSQLGLFLASEIKSHVTTHFNVKIKEIEYSKYFKIDNSGTKILSRDIDDLNGLSSKKTFILAGSYALTSRQLMMYLKLIDMKTGELLQSTSTSIPLNSEIIDLENERNTPFVIPHVVL